MLARVAGELPADQVQVVRGVAVGVGDAAVPAGQPRAGADRGLQPGELGPASMVPMRVALQERSTVAMRSASAYGAGESAICTSIAVLSQVRDEQIGGGDGRVAFPAAAHHERDTSLR